MTNRRHFLKTGSGLSAGILLHKTNLFAQGLQGFESKRPPPGAAISCLFENCFPNTPDTTVDFEMVDGKPDTYVITGDIDAMWLRDSTAQVWPCLCLVKGDARLQQLIISVQKNCSPFHP